MIEDMSRDFRLTALDWRVMVYLLSRSGNWKVSQADIAARVLSEERAVRQSLIHLEELEYGHRVMRHGEKQSYMADFVLNYTSPSIPTTRNRSSGSSGVAVPVQPGTTVPVEAPPAAIQPELQHSQPEPQLRFNRNANAGSTGTTVPTTEQEQNSRQNSTTEQDGPAADQQNKLVDTNNLEPGTYINSKGGISYTDDDAGDAAQLRAVSAMRFDFTGQPKTSSTSGFSGLIRAKAA